MSSLNVAKKVKVCADMFGVQVAAEVAAEQQVNIDVVLKALGFPLVGQRFPQAVQYRNGKVIR